MDENLDAHLNLREKAVGVLALVLALFSLISFCSDPSCFGHDVFVNFIYKKSMINRHIYQSVERHNACQALAIYANLDSLCNLGPSI